MVKRNKIVYWLLLLAVVLFVVLTLLIRETQARYVNTAIWNTLVSGEGDRNVVLDNDWIIDLGMLSVGQTDVTFTVAEELPADAQLTCSLSQKVTGLTAQVQEDAGVYKMTLELTEWTDSSLTEVNIVVVANDMMLGTFRTVLPVAEPEVPEQTENTGENGKADSNDIADAVVPMDELGDTVVMEEQTDAEAVLTVTERLVPESYLVVEISPPDGTDRVEITLGDNGFPALSRYSLDYGQSWYLLYFGGTIWVDCNGEVSMLVDVSNAKEKPNGQMTVAAQLYSGQAETASYNAETVFENLQLQASAILTKEENSLVLSLPESLQKYDLTYTVEMLTAGEEGALQYVETDRFEISISEDGYTMTVQFGEDAPQAGTYRLSIRWSYLEVCLIQNQTTFFINYSETRISGGAG